MTARCELPLARALIAAHGRDTAMEILRRAAADDVDERIHTLAWEAVGSKLERYVDDTSGDVNLQCVFALTPDDGEASTLDRAIYWDNEGIVACGRSIPETMIDRLAGRKMAEIFDHPFLEGLTVSGVHNHRDGETCAVVADADDCMWDLERIGIAA